MLGSWAGAKIICVGEYAKTGDYPPGMLTEEEKEEISHVVTDKEGCPRTGMFEKICMSDHRAARLDNKQLLCTAYDTFMEERFKQSHEMSMRYDAATNTYPKTADYKFAETLVEVCRSSALNNSSTQSPQLLPKRREMDPAQPHCQGVRPRGSHRHRFLGDPRAVHRGSGFRTRRALSDLLVNRW